MRSRQPKHASVLTQELLQTRTAYQSALEVHKQDIAERDVHVADRLAELEAEKSALGKLRQITSGLPE